MSYELSNTNDFLEISKVSKTLKDKVQKVIKDGYTQKQLQVIADYVCKSLRVPSVVVSLKGKRPVSKRGVLHGTYKRSTQLVTVYGITPKTNKTVAPKTILDTLYHEIMHHYDFKKLQLNSSPHTAGFYKRIGELKKLTMI